MQTSLSPLPVKIRHTADGIATSYSCAVELTSNSFLEVYLDGEIQPIGWSYDVENKQVIFDVAPAEGVVINFLRQTPISYEHSITEKGIINTEVLDNQSVNLVAMLQEVDEKLSRAPVLPINSEKNAEDVYSDFERMENNARISSEEAIQAAEEVKGLRDETINSLNSSVTDAKNVITKYTDNMIKSVDEATAGYIDEARVWSTGTQEEVNKLEEGERSSRAYANISAAYAETPEDVPVEDGDINTLEFIKGDKGDKGEDGVAGGGWELFDFKYSDHKINNYGWVRSNLQWCYGSTYLSGYNLLVEKSEDMAYTLNFYKLQKDGVDYLINYTSGQLKDVEGNVKLYVYQEDSTDKPVVYSELKASDILADETYTWPNGNIETFSRDYKFKEITYTDKYYDGYNFSPTKTMIKRDGWARFGNSSIITLPVTIPTNVNSEVYNWEYITHFITGSDVATRQVLLNAQYLGTSDYGYILDINASKINFYGSSNNSSWDIASNISGTTTLTVYTEYWVKFRRSYDSETSTATYEIFLSRDGENWNKEITVTSALMLSSTIFHKLVIGNKTSDTARYFRGYINLKDSYFKALSPEMVELNWEAYNYVDIKYYRTSDERKVCLPNQIDNLKKVIQSTGQAWYYILDEYNERFRLPYSENYPRWSNKNVGDYQEDMSQDFVIHTSAGDNQFDIYAKMIGRSPLNIMYPEENVENIHNYTYGSNTADIDWERMEARMSNKFNAGDQVSPRSTNFYLYFYLGSVVIEAASIDVNGFSEALSNKMEKDLSNADLGMLDVVVDYYPKTSEEKEAEAAAGTHCWYRLYKSGWIEQGGTSLNVPRTGVTIGLKKTMADENFNIIATCKFNGVQNEYGLSVFPLSNSSFLITLGGYNGGQPNLPCYWQVKGQVYSGEQ